MIKRISLNSVALLLFLLSATLFPFNASSMTSPSGQQSVEICDNRIDDDGDGLIDCYDPDCSGDLSCWDCEEEFYQVHSNSAIVKLNTVTGTYSQVATVSGASEINGADLNHLDGHVYAPCIINGQHKLGMLMNDGSVVDQGLSLQGSGIFYVGGISIEGNMYVNRGSGSIYKIDLSQETLTSVATSASNPGVADIAVDNTTGLFYGITGSSDLKVFDPYTESLSTYNLAGSINNESGAFGATWSSSDGSFFAYNNSSGKIFSVDINNLTATEVLNATGNLSINDGFNCVTAAPPFETLCNNGIDDDGDGVIDCADGDCYNSNECTYEICDNGIDDDGDGWADCSDTECFYLSYCFEDCSNGIDDNGNGLIDGNDPQCNTPSGVSGGLESNGSLADQISKRNINLVLEGDELVEMKKEGIIPFNPASSKGAFDLSTFIPQQVSDAYVAESTPTDLIGITNAIDVIAADYYIENQRVGSILAIQSNGVYEHTKYICDRLEGSRLLDLSHLYAKGGLFMSYELLNSQLNVEYAASFSVHYDETKGFIIENHWNLDAYPEDKEYYNFQVWANDYGQLNELINATLNKFIEKDYISKINHSDLPRLFVTYGDYKNGNLNLHIRNKNGVDNFLFTAMARRTETSDWEEIEMQIPLNGLQFEIVDLPVGYLYDFGGSIYSEGSVSDEIFLADGRWTLDSEHAGANIKDYTISAQDEDLSDDGYQIERGLSVRADVNDYLNIYRSFDPKYNPVNLSEFNTISFVADGEGLMEVTLVKESIENWADQPRTNIRLEGSSNTYNLHQTQFTQLQDGAWDDVVMIVFTLVNDQESMKQFDVTLEDLIFINTVVSSTQIIQKIETSVLTPNPVSTNATLQMTIDIPRDAQINIYSAIGTEVMTLDIKLSQGENQKKLNLSNLESGYFYYLITDGESTITSGTFMKL